MSVILALNYMKPGINNKVITDIQYFSYPNKGKLNNLATLGV